MSLIGHRTDTGERSVTVPYGTPRYWALPSRKLTKDELEMWQLGQFCLDLYSSTGEWVTPFGAVKGEHPDFRLPQHRTDDEGVGVELAAFTVGPRRAIEPAIESVRAVVQAEPTRYEHLAGCHVWIMPKSGHPLQQLRSQADAIAETLSKIARPVPTDSGPYPGVFPEGSFVSEAVDADMSVTVYERFPHDQASDHPVLRSPLVDVEFTVEMTFEEARTELLRVIENHSYEGCDRLVITAGGPNQLGAGTTEDEAILNFLLANDPPTNEWIAPRHGSVVVHFWLDGRIVELFPTFAERAGGRPEHARRTSVVSYRTPDDPGSLSCVELARGVNLATQREDETPSDPIGPSRDSARSASGS
jgi:hypothetical protein